MIEDELLRRFLAFVEAHSAAVAARFLPRGEGFSERRALVANGLPCLHWLDSLDAEGAEARTLVSFLRRERDSLRWGQTYAAGDFGPAFLQNYGWVEVFGARGPFAHGELAGGLLLLGPDTHYPDHRHIAEEIYIPLTGGSEWRAGDEPFRTRAAGEVIHHPSNLLHAMRTGERPLLAAYLWRGGPLDQKSEIGAAP